MKQREIIQALDKIIEFAETERFTGNAMLGIANLREALIKELHQPNVYRPVIQEWVCRLPYMQQTVLLTCVRGPDGLHKEHPAKNILRWFRRCTLVSAFDGEVLTHPDQPGGGSFTGPQTMPLHISVRKYRGACDEVPHHFQMHVMHAAEILGYKHPDPRTREWWRLLYYVLVNDLHLFPEEEIDMDSRLGDNPAGWRGASALGDRADFTWPPLPV